jgi:hypothetical protein
MRPPNPAQWCRRTSKGTPRVSHHCCPQVPHTVLCCGVCKRGGGNPAAPAPLAGAVRPGLCPRGGRGGGAEMRQLGRDCSRPVHPGRGSPSHPRPLRLWGTGTPDTTAGYCVGTPQGKARRTSSSRCVRDSFSCNSTASIFGRETLRNGSHTVTNHQTRISSGRLAHTPLHHLRTKLKGGGRKGNGQRVAWARGLSCVHSPTAPQYSIQARHEWRRGPRGQQKSSTARTRALRCRGTGHGRLRGADGTPTRRSGCTALPR